MSTAGKNNAGKQLWGIYHTLPEHAGITNAGQGLRTVIKARSKIAAEEIAAQLGFGEPSARRVNSETARKAQWLPTRNGKSVRRNAKGIRV